MNKEAIEWANKQVEKLEFNLKAGDKLSAIQAKVKLQKINSLSQEEFEECAVESYKTYLNSVQ